MLEYRGYRGQAAYDEEAKLFHGEIVGIRSVVTFQAEAEEDIETAFRESVDDYLDWCAERERDPEIPWLAKFSSDLSTV